MRGRHKRHGRQERHGTAGKWENMGEGDYEERWDMGNRGEREMRETWRHGGIGSLKGKHWLIMFCDCLKEVTNTYPLSCTTAQTLGKPPPENRLYSPVLMFALLYFSFAVSSGSGTGAHHTPYASMFIMENHNGSVQTGFFWLVLVMAGDHWSVCGQWILLFPYIFPDSVKKLLHVNTHMPYIP